MEKVIRCRVSCHLSACNSCLAHGSKGIDRVTYICGIYNGTCLYMVMYWLHLFCMYYKYVYCVIYVSLHSWYSLKGHKAFGGGTGRY